MHPRSPTPREAVGAHSSDDELPLGRRPAKARRDASRRREVTHLKTTRQRRIVYAQLIGREQGVSRRADVVNVPRAVAALRNQRRARERSRETIMPRVDAARLMCSARVPSPTLKRIVDDARLRDMPMASNPGLGSALPRAHVLPVVIAMPSRSMLIMTASPSTSETSSVRMPGARSAPSPTRRHPWSSPSSAQKPASSAS